MAKKSQTRARRNNTQVGPQVVNFYNHGTVNVDARQNNSTSTKYAHANCTVNYTPQPGRSFTLQDQLEEDHPILGWVEPKTVKPIRAVPFTRAKIHEQVETEPQQTSWKVLATVGTALALAVGFAAVKYFNN